MTDAERAADLANEIEQHDRVAIYYDGDGAYLSQKRVDMIVTALRLLAEQSAPAPAPTDLREMVAGMIGGGSTFDREDRLEMAGDILSAIQRDNVILPREPTPAMLQVAWRAFRGDRKGPLLDGAGPAFKEAISAVLTVKETAP